MCGRYTDSKRNKAMLASAGFQVDLAFVPRYNIAPTQEASIVALGEDGRPEHKSARWGLLPVWTKGSSIPASLINARAETVASRPSFRASYLKRRCLVLADRFYEWQKRDSCDASPASSLPAEAEVPQNIYLKARVLLRGHEIEPKVREAHFPG